MYVGSHPSAVYWMDIFSQMDCIDVCLKKTENKLKRCLGWQNRLVGFNGTENQRRLIDTF